MWTVIDKNTRAKLYNTIYQNIVLNDNEELVDFIADVMSEESILINQQNKEFELYLKRKSDGETAYLKLSAEFRLAKLSGAISEEEHSALEELLTPVRNEVMFGQWKKGLELLEKIPVEMIGNSLYNRLHTQLTAYINQNY